MSSLRLRPAGTVAIAVLLVSGSLSFSQAHGRENAGGGAFIGHDFRTRARVVRDFWTKARMRSAPPISEAAALAPIETDGWSTSVRSQQVLRTTLQQDAPFERREITDPSVYPYRVHGKLFVQAGGMAYHCSATVVNSANESVVFTAGHCLYGEDIGGWVDTAAFVPGYQFGNRPYGTWVAQSAFTTPGWLNEESTRADIGALVMSPLDGDSIVDTVGGRAIAFEKSRQQTYEAFGYPAVGQFDGERLYVCVADAFSRDATPAGSGPDPTGIGCDMTQGSSGGGWVINGSSLNSVNSYGYQNSGGSDLPYMFGPYFGSIASALFAEAESVQVGIPTPTPSASVTPTELPAASPSPTPMTPRRAETVTDADDSRGPFDISTVSVSDESGTVTIDLSTHDSWGLRLLSPSHRHNRFFLDFDSVGGGRPDFYLTVLSRDGRLVGRIYDYAPGRDSMVGAATIEREGSNGFVASLSGDMLGLDAKLRWYASSSFKARNRCVRGCIDSAPDDTMVEM